MSRIKKIGFGLVLLAVAGIVFAFYDSTSKSIDSGVLTYEIDLQKQDLRFFWKDEKGKNYQSFKNLKNGIEAQGIGLVFAVNGGMYQEDLSPLGLYIENGVEKHKINRIVNAHGNFYMQPNGVFAITKTNKGFISTTANFKPSSDIKYATQSGPMLVIDGKLHPKFMKGSNNLNIRNGLGVLPNGKLLFVISKEKINFYDFATYFQSRGCKNALYLDGFVSRTYLPSKGATDLGGNFGVIIGEVKR